MRDDTLTMVLAWVGSLSECVFLKSIATSLLVATYRLPPNQVTNLRPTPMTRFITQYRAFAVAHHLKSWLLSLHAMYVVNTQHNYGAYRDPSFYQPNERSMPSVDNGPRAQTTPTQFVRAKQRIHESIYELKPTLLQLISWILTLQVFLVSATWFITVSLLVILPTSSIPSHLAADASHQGHRRHLRASD